MDELDYDLVGLIAKGSLLIGLLKGWARAKYKGHGDHICTLEEIVLTRQNWVTPGPEAKGQKASQAAEGYLGS